MKRYEQDGRGVRRGIVCGRETRTGRLCKRWVAHGGECPYHPGIPLGSLADGTRLGLIEGSGS